jgi:serine/threonine protein kinase
MTSVPASSERPEAPLFSDGLGDRVVAVDGATGDLLQILRLRPQLLAVPSFEFALRERAARLANFRHAYYARVRRVDRHPGGLAIVSDHVEGTRLSDILRVASERRLHLDLSAALCLIRQLVPSVALLHENARDVAHGLIAPERLVVTPHARLVIAEHVLGSAVEQLQYNRERLWHELRVGLPSSAGAPRFDHRADVTAIGLVALALILGRPLGNDDYSNRIPVLLHEARAKSAMGEEQPLPSTLRAWLARALQLDSRHGFPSATEAQVALEDVLADDTAIVAAPVALETFLSRYIAALLEPMPVPVSNTPPPPFVAPAAPAPVAPAAVNEFASEFLTPPAQPAPPVSTERSVSAGPVHAAPPHPQATLPAPPPVMPAASSVPQATPSAAPDIADVLRSMEPIGSTVKDQQPHGTPFPSSKRAKKPRGIGPRRLAIAGIAVAVIGAGGYFGGRALKKAPPPASGTLSVQTNPPGVAVFVDGVAHGNSPARLTLGPGSHILELRGRGVPRVVPITVTAGAEVSQYLELPETPSTGSLLIQSDPPGAHVTVDGEAHGAAPVSVADLAPGDHEVVLQADGGSPVRQHVVIQAGVTSSVLAPVATAAAGPVSGWLSIKAPVAMEIREGGRLLGTSEADRIMMTAGKHDLEIVNETLGYRSLRSVQVPPGKVAALGIDLPQGAINLNASPWAEVWIDGRRVGETPIGNLPIAIGPHEIVFRHPQFGEKRQAVSVSLNAPMRVSVDMK